MGFFAKTQEAGLLDDRRKDVKTTKKVFKILFFPIRIFWKLLCFAVNNSK